jgi:methylated-DNA-protein-cysteine methyltransferase-like protein
MDTQLNEMIWQVLALIPKGKVATYGQIAKLCGYPGYARYVGHTLKQLPQGTGLPWHRVINAKGQISFSKGSDAYQVQRTRLKQEGIVFDGEKICLKRYQWDGTPSDSGYES